MDAAISGFHICTYILFIIYITYTCSRPMWLHSMPVCHIFPRFQLDRCATNKLQLLHLLIDPHLDCLRLSDRLGSSLKEWATYKQRLHMKHCKSWDLDINTKKPALNQNKHPNACSIALLQNKQGQRAKAHSEFEKPASRACHAAGVDLWPETLGTNSINITNIPIPIGSMCLKTYHIYCALI